MAETLTDLLLQARKRHGNASGRRLAEIADANPGWGGSIDRTQVNQILNGTYKSKPGRKVLLAIAGLAGVEPGRAYIAAGVPLPGPPFADDLPPEVDYLTPRQRRAVVGVIQAFLARDAMEIDDDEYTQKTQPAPRGRKRALHAVDQDDDDLNPEELGLGAAARRGEVEPGDQE